MRLPNNRVSLPVQERPVASNNSTALLFQKSAAALITVIPQFSLASQIYGDSSNLVEAQPWIDKKYIACCHERFIRKPTAIFSTILNIEHHQFVVFIQLRTDSRYYLQKLAEEFFSHFDQNITNIQYHGIIDMPNDQPYYLGQSEDDKSLHIKRTHYLNVPQEKNNSEIDGINTILAFARTIQNAMHEMAEKYINNKVVTKGDNQELHAIQLQEVVNQYQRLFAKSDSGVDSTYSSSLYFFFDNKPYKTPCSMPFAWLGEFLASFMGLVYGFYGSYLLFQLADWTLIFTAPVCANSVIRRVCVLTAKNMESVNGGLYKKTGMLGNDKVINQYFKQLATLQRAREGGKSYSFYRDEMRSCFPLGSYVSNRLLHFYMYSQWRFIAHLPENLATWVAYLSGLVGWFGSKYVNLAGLVLGMGDFLLRMLLQKTDKRCDGKKAENIMMLFVAFFYGFCYMVKDMIASHFSLLYLSDYLQFHNGTLNNITKAKLLNGTVPWSNFNYTNAFSLPYLDKLSPQSQMGWILGVSAFILLGYWFLMSRSYHETNPPGSKRFGYTGFIDALGVLALLFFFCSDLFYMATQSAEMLFAVMLVAQLLYAISLLNGESLLFLAFNVVNIAAIILGFVLGMVNMVMGGLLLNPGPQPWLLVVEEAKLGNPQLTLAIQKVYVDFLQYQAYENKDIKTANEFMAWLKQDSYQDKKTVWIFLQSCAINNHWKVFRIIMQKIFPCPNIVEASEWEQLNKKIYKSSPVSVVNKTKSTRLDELNHVVITKMDSKDKSRYTRHRNEVANNVRLWMQRKGYAVAEEQDANQPNAMTASIIAS